MTLAPGSRLGLYDIIAPVGAGGMGEVYRARDTRIGRDVAIKILPAAMGQDTEGLRRFEAAARAASQLNHPNIVVVYDVGAYEGVAYVAFELLAGETLREIIDRGPISQRAVVEYGRQIARGLASAHDAGLVHRDLKPSSLFVTRDGVVKILDFGLAKERPSPAPAERTGTIESPLADGVVLGTAGYVSPEQIRGERVDWRADIFAFGVVLYEMLTGKRPFSKSSTMKTHNATLQDSPLDLSATAPATDPALARAIERCLEKKPADRFQSAKDLGFAFETLSLTSGPRITARSPAAGRWRLGAAAVAVLGFAGVGLWLARREPPRAPSAYRQVTSDGRSISVDLSPDGETIAYVARGRLMVRDISGGAAVEIYRSEEGLYAPRWSHSGRFIAVPTLKEMLIVPRFGGPPVRLKAPGMAYKISWSPDDSKIFASSHNKFFWEASLSSLESRRVEINGPFLATLLTDVSPDGDRLLLHTKGANSKAEDGVWSMKKDGTDLRALVRERRAIWDARWSSDGSEVYYLLMGPSTGEVRRARVVDGGLDPAPSVVQSDLAVSGSPINSISMSQNGRLAYSRIDRAADLWRADVSPSLSSTDPIPMKAVTRGGLSQGPRFSPDGTRLVFARSDGELGQIVVSSSEGEAPQVLVSRRGAASRPVWSPDGEQIAYVFDDDADGPAIHVLNVRTAVDRVLTKVISSTELAWAPGARLAHTTPEGENYALVDLPSGKQEMLLNQPDERFGHSPSVSNRGDRMAMSYGTDGKGENWLATASLQDRSVRLIAKAPPIFFSLGWSADDVSIYGVLPVRVHETRQPVSLCS